jgi:transcriptional regulator with XRE-family HTH domain
MALRQVREARGWSDTAAVRALRRHAPNELPAEDTMVRQWRRRESGKTAPSGFYRLLLATALGVEPEQIFAAEAPAVELLSVHDELVRRRDAILATMNDLQTRLDYINALLAVPEPAIADCA